ncbi:DMT family transporter [Jiangella rhizosphaerae]|uniref:DMT family transporter n=1 Tax=Jiangella rhizosphaerae TaxID=2293569 RepID=UPI0011C4505E|nr:DMT family transporter [Jiangella rhizosphaerae]
MSSTGLAVAFAVGAASLHALAALGMVARRRWWYPTALTVAASGLHVCALHYGPLTLVQPLGVLSLAFALVLSWGLTRRRVTPREWRGMALSMAGLAALLLLAAPTRPRSELSSTQILLLTLAVVALIAVAVGAASRLPLRPVRRSLLFALAAGTTFGVSSALTQTVTIRVADSGLSAALQPASAVVLVLASTGLLLSRRAYRGGLGAPLATATIVNPVTASAIGIGLLGERFTGGPIEATVSVAAALTAAAGVVLLARGSRAPVTRPARPERVPATR